VKKKSLNGLHRLIAGLILPALLLGLWHFASSRSATVVPSLGEVWAVLAHPLRQPPNLDSPSLFACTAISLARVAVGYALAVFSAVPLGLAVGRSDAVRRIVMPLVEFGRPICPIAWMPLAIILFGFSSLGSTLWGDQAWRHDFLGQIQFAMVAIIWWGAFFPILLASVQGVEQTRTLYLEAALMLRATRRQLFRHVILPSALPSILTGLRVGLGLAWMVIIAAEIFPGTRSGLGYMITTSHQVAQYEYAFACILIIGVLGFGMNAALRALSLRVGRWQAKER